MAFVVEDGTGVAAANAYCAVAFVDDYHSFRNNTKWAGTTAVKQACIIRATDYVDQRFMSVYRGERRNQSQGLEWPRYNALNNNGYFYEGVPVNLQKAVAEYAIRALLIGVLAPDPAALAASQSMVIGESSGTGAAGGPVTLVAKEIGPIKVETRYSDPSKIRQFHSVGVVSGQSLSEYPAADLWLTSLIRNPMSLDVRRA